jgi:thioredoxin 1
MAMITIKKFSRPGCRPCSILANYLNEVNFAEHDAELVNVDIYENPDAVEKYGLSSVPVLVFERNGLEVTRMIGLHPADAVIDAIQYAKEVR